MKAEELRKILDQHLKWFKCEEGGERADLRNANLRGADLRNANLRNANLGNANLRNANLENADLRGANLRGADLRNANLGNANLGNVDLENADLGNANLGNANLENANLRNTNLRNANLRGANLRGADLGNANLGNTNLRNVDLRGIKDADKMQDILISHTSICPEGTIIGWKKCRNNVIVKLEIPAEARRNNATGRKCRAEYAKVLEVIGASVGISQYDNEIEYREGEIIKPDKWDDNRWDECSNGIHFFITRLEAENY